MQNYIYRCERCNSVIEAPKELMCSSCICPVCSHVQIPAPSRQQISNQNVLRATVKGYSIAFTIALVMGGLFSGILPLLIGAAIAMATIVIPVWFFTNVLMDFFHGQEQGYKDYRRNGGSPFWDNVLGNQTEHYVLQNPEPHYSNFVPAGHWKYQCNSCNARVEGDLNPCWNCGITLDSSSRDSPQ